MNELIVVGGGPAGAVCAALCARAGWKVTVLERELFPREKVCGDCLNPGCWPIFDRLGLSERVLALPHAKLTEIAFVDVAGRQLVYPLPRNGRAEIAVKRSALDALLLDHARACGATICERAHVARVERTSDGQWHVSTRELPNEPMRTTTAPLLVAADGRNSTISRLLLLLPPARKDRVGLQTHLPLPSSAAGRVVMRFLRDGYCGLADVGQNEANLCLVAHPARMDRVKAWATDEFSLSEDQEWRSITPLERAPVSTQHSGLLLVGDAARVVEPFTGEGIYYALASGALAADCLLSGDLPSYPAAHRALYRGRLWVNHLARAACKHPALASTILQAARVLPGVLGLLTRKVVESPRGR